MDSNTESEYRGKGYNTILRIIIILISKIIGINFIISLPISPMSKYILNKLNFISEVDETILHPNFIPYIHARNTVKNKDIYKQIIDEKYHMLPDIDKTELLEFIDNQTKNQKIPKIAIKKKFIEILSRNKQILLDNYKTNLFDYEHRTYKPKDVIEFKDNETNEIHTGFTHYINLEKYNEIDNLKIELLSKFEKNIDIIKDINGIEKTIDDLFLIIGGYKKKKKYKSKKKKKNSKKKSNKVKKN